jgi:hypothetical protein
MRKWLLAFTILIGFSGWIGIDDGAGRLVSFYAVWAAWHSAIAPTHISQLGDLVFKES